MNKAKVSFTLILLFVFALIFGPAAYATFVVHDETSSWYGYGYGHDASVWGYGYGYGDITPGGGSSHSGGGGSVVATTSATTTLSEGQLIAYYERIIALLRALVSKKSGGRVTPVSRVVKTKSLNSISLTLRAGSRGAEVKALQQFLIDQDTGPQAKKLARTGATGIFSKATEAALKEYQKANDIKATGVYGPATQKFVKSQLVK